MKPASHRRLPRVAPLDYDAAQIFGNIGMLGTAHLQAADEQVCVVVCVGQIHKAVQVDSEDENKQDGVAGALEDRHVILV